MGLLQDAKKKVSGTTGARGTAAGMILNPFDPASAQLGGRSEAFFKTKQGKKLLESIGRGGRSPAKIEADKKKEREKAAKQAKKEAARIQAEREKKTGQIKKLFTNMKLPKATKASLMNQLKKTENIDTFRERDRAQSDVNRLRGIADTEGDTAIAGRLLEEQGLEQKTALEDLEQQQALQGQSAFESLASRGGAGAGSRERLLAQTGKQSLLEGQRQRRFGQQQRAGIRSEDEGRKLGLATQLPGQQLALAQARQSEQQSQAGIDLQKASQLQGASQFDAAAKQAALQFKVGGKSKTMQQALDQGSQFASAQALADQQRKINEANKRSPIEKAFDPAGIINKGR